MREQELRWERTNAISYDPKVDSGKRFHYFQEWHYVHVDLIEYDLLRSYRALEADFRGGDFEGDEWVPRTKEGHEKYRDLVRAMIKPTPQSNGVGIYGKGRIERDKIHVVSIQDPDRPSKDDPVNLSFQDIEVGIRSSGAETTTGTLFFSDENPRHPKLNLEVYLADTELKSLVADIRSSSTRPTLRVTVQALLFQDEVEASLREPYHAQELMIPQRPGAALAILNTVRFSYDKPASVAEVYDDPEDAPKPSQPPPSPMMLQLPDSMLQIAKSLKGALYVLAAAVVVAGFLIGR
jgi:hypothetical protein